MKFVKKTIMFILAVIIAAIWLFPFYIMIVNSFKSKREIFVDTLGLPKTLSFANYTEAASKLDLALSIRNSLTILIISLIIIIIFSSMAAYALERNKTKTSTITFLVFAGAMLVPFQSVMIPLIKLFGFAQLLNMGGLAFMYLGFGSSLAIFLYHGALKGIPVSLDEAATIDGCSRFRLFWKIVFPNLSNITITVAILDTIWIWNDYLLPSLVINKAKTMTIPLKVFFFFGQYTRQWHLAMAGLILAIIPVIIFYFISQRQIINGITAGAVKQ